MKVNEGMIIKKEGKFECNEKTGGNKRERERERERELIRTQNETLPCSVTIFLSS